MGDSIVPSTVSGLSPAKSCSTFLPDSQCAARHLLSNFDGETSLSTWPTCTAKTSDSAKESVHTTQSDDEGSQRIFFEPSTEQLVPIWISERLIGGKVMEGYLRIVRDADYQTTSTDIVTMDADSKELFIVDLTKIFGIQFAERGDWALYASRVPKGVDKSAYSTFERQREYAKWGIPLGVIVGPLVLAGVNYYAFHNDPLGGNFERMMGEAIERVRPPGAVPNGDEE